MSKLIPLSNGGTTLVDDDDYEYLSKFRWHKSPKNYVRRTVNFGNENGRFKYRLINFSRLIMKPKRELQIDHINGNKLDNRKVNLRIVTHSQNTFNRKKRGNSTSKFKGVCFASDKRKKCWRSFITKNGKRICLGSFVNERDAAIAYDAAARTMFGEYAKPNFPDSML